MKKRKVLFGSLVVLSAFGLEACKGNDVVNTTTEPVVEPEKKVVKYNVTFKDGDSVLKTVEVKKGSKVEEYSPKKDLYDFVGWFKDSQFKEKMNFSESIESNLTLYAKFTYGQAPVTLASDGKSFTYGYKGEETTYSIDEHHIFVDGSLSDEVANKFSNVYNSFNQALLEAKSGDINNPTKIYIAPNVYWMHDPKSESTNEEFGMVKECAYLNIIGLTNNPRNVVIAANYGHNEGFDGGNWTMFKIKGDGLTLTNVTFGDYCNVDLDYPLDPTKNVARRTDNITQGQIGIYEGDRFYAKNCRFISRLNMMPFISSARSLYEDCHLESTDDSINGSSRAVYLNCDFDFYSGKPWYSSQGSTLLNCDFNIKHVYEEENVKQYLAKAQSRFNVVDCRFKTEKNPNVSIGWSDLLDSDFRSFYSNVTCNGKPISFDLGGVHKDNSVDITGTDFLKAYKLEDNGKVIYNIYNLLRGNDDWDPLGQKEVVTRLKATDVPTDFSLSTTARSIESGVSTATLSISLKGLFDTDYLKDNDVTYFVSEEDKDYVSLTKNSDGTCLVTGTNNTEEAREVVVNAKLESGHEQAVAIKVSPTILDAPKFSVAPKLSQNNDGTASLSYTLDLGERKDLSRVIWYVCDKDGLNPIQIAYGREEEALKSIPLTEGYVGRYLMATIEPKHIRSNYGDMATVISETPITSTGISETKRLTTDFKNFATTPQTEVIKGFFSMDGYVPKDTQAGYIPFDSTEVSDKYSAKVKNWRTTSNNAWTYGTGEKNGFLNYSGIVQQARGARLRYTPFGDTYGDMSLTVKLAPGKTANQGFGSDYQYMDIMIKYDTTNLTGYGVRIYRSTSNSCEFVLMEYRDGYSKEICTPVRTACFNTECTVKIWTEGTKLCVTASTTKDIKAVCEENGYAETVKLEATVAENTFGGFGIHHTGTCGANSTYIGSIDCEWK